MLDCYQVYAGVVLVFAMLGFTFFGWMVFLLTLEFIQWLKSKWARP